MTKNTTFDPSYEGDVIDDKEMDLLFHVSLEAPDLVPSLQSELATSLVSIFLGNL